MNDNIDFNALIASTNLMNVEDNDSIPQVNFAAINAHTLVAKVFSDKSFNDGVAKNTLLKAWNAKKKVVVNIMENHKIRVTIDLNNPLKDLVVIHLSPGVNISVEIKYERLGDFVTSGTPWCGTVDEVDGLLSFGTWLWAESIFSQRPTVISSLSLPFSVKSPTFIPSTSHNLIPKNTPLPVSKSTIIAPTPLFDPSHPITEKGPFTICQFQRPKLNLSFFLKEAVNAKDIDSKTSDCLPIAFNGIDVDMALKTNPKYFSSEYASAMMISYYPINQPTQSLNPSPLHFDWLALLGPSSSIVNKPNPLHLDGLPIMDPSFSIMKKPNSLIPIQRTPCKPDLEFFPISRGKEFVESSAGGFKEILEEGGLIDLGFEGHPFTWSNQRGRLANIQLRLDRCVANFDWIEIFPKAFVSHLPAINSDHSPLFFVTDSSFNYGPKPFRFKNMWIRDPSCKDMVFGTWSGYFHGSPPFVLHSKIKITFQGRDKSTENCRLEMSLVKDLNKLLKPEDLIPNLVTNEDNEIILSIPSSFEIKQVIFAMSSNKTLGPNEMSSSFFKSYWSIVGDDVTKVKSIVGCKELVSKGLCFSMSVENHVRTWEDSWIPSLKDFTSAPIDISAEDYARSFSVREDQKSRFENNHIGDPQFWKRLWKAKIHERSKIFLWHPSCGIIPTGVRLQRFMPDFNPMCLLCNNVEELIKHIFIGCSFARKAWWSSKWALRTYGFGDLDIRTRNSVLHGAHLDPIDDIVRLAESRAHEHFTFQKSKKIAGTCCPLDSQWIPTDCSDLVVFTDAAFNDGVMCVGLVVKRSSDFIFGATKMGFALDACDAKLIAIKEACHWLDWAHISKVSFVSDCHSAVSLISSNSTNFEWRYHSIVEEIRGFFSCFSDWHISSVDRKSNRVAHNIAQWGKIRNWNVYIYLRSLPGEMEPEEHNSLPFIDLRDSNTEMEDNSRDTEVGNEDVSELATLPVLSFEGAQVGSATLNLKSAPADTARAVVHRGLTTDLTNRRRGTASTLTRAEVRGGGRKPYPQKKTGGARRGSNRTPLRPGGGVIFGPKPKDWSVKINKKEKRLAISTAISSASQSTFVIEDFDDKFEKPKTKEFIAMMKRLGLDPKKKSTFLMTEVSDNVKCSSRNVKTLKMLTPRTLNLFDILDAENLVLTKGAVEFLNQRREAEEVEVNSDSAE
ncbi:hypothetical protein BUALT_Bualt13G0089700 [Buddleja alternifolia]|uniref:Large ribosomal subunit protein uL4c n=1 Tax=Buddleja alternifolia TaxID=168488 RepID=A0AAV6WL73_9LAMI|nr:hypothetical protein BUALT_Bualt13G0089700 [Buddleja alternifolia]